MSPSSDRNLIYEKYGTSLTRWSADKFSDTCRKIIIRNFDYGEAADEFDDTFVPKKWFSWKNVFKKLKGEQISVEGAGVRNGCRAEVTFSYDLDEEEFRGLVFGGEDKKYGGLIYNPEFEGLFKKLGVSAPDDGEDDDPDGPGDEDADDPDEPGGAAKRPGGEDADDPDGPGGATKKAGGEDADDPDDVKAESSARDALMRAYRRIIMEQADSLNVKVIFSFAVIMAPGVIGEQAGDAPASDAPAPAAPKMRAKDYLNPNYITEFKGDIRLEFNGVPLEKSVGTARLQPKRTKDMDMKPRFSLQDAMKSLWTDTMKAPSDFGIVGVAAKRMINGAVGGLAHGLVDGFAVERRREFSVTIESAFAYTNSLKAAKGKGGAQQKPGGGDGAEGNGGAGDGVDVTKMVEDAFAAANLDLKFMVDDQYATGKFLKVEILTPDEKKKLIRFYFKYD